MHRTRVGPRGRVAPPGPGPRSGTLAACPRRTGSTITRLAQRNPLPEGTLAVGAGLIVSGLAIYGFFAITGRVLSDEQFAPVSQVWFATFILAPGFFLPLEQEVGRALAHRRALGQGAMPVVKRAVVLAIGLAILVDLVLLALSPFLIDEFFSGKWGLVPALLLGVHGLRRHALRPGAPLRHGTLRRLRHGDRHRWAGAVHGVRRAGRGGHRHRRSLRPPRGPAGDRRHRGRPATRPPG